ncbi:MAG: hypothetical protein FWC47_02675 [Oscillospiraceae bacterium]|nr:hypothetical protein [Oscillospiraceae bacterium]
MTTVVMKNSLEMSYKFTNDMGKEVSRTNSIPFDIDATDANMLAVSKAVYKVTQYAIINTVNVKRTMILE